MEFLPCNFTMGEQVRENGTADFYVIKSIEARRSNKGYTYYDFYCLNLDTGDTKVFKEWSIVTNE